MSDGNDATYTAGSFEASYLPPGLGEVSGEWREETRTARDLTVRVRTFHPDPEGLRAIAAHLREARRRLVATPVARLLDVFDGLADRWLDRDDELRGEVVLGIAAATGFSPEMAAHAIDLEQESSRRDHLERALAQELGDPNALDGLVANRFLLGRTRVLGPPLIGAVFSANIPGLPHLEIMRAFAVKSALLGKVASGEPIFLGAYARTLAEAAPDLADCLAVVGLDRDDEAARDALLGELDHLVAYGGQEAITTLQRACPPGLDATWHGHRIGFAVLQREALTRDGVPALADAVGYDFSLFDQEACLAPAAVYVERGGEVSPEQFAEALEMPMRDQARDFPPRELPLPEAAARRTWLDDQRMDGRRVVSAPNGLPWIVVYDEDPGLTPTPPGRTVRVVPVDDASEALTHVAPLRRYLQCCAVSGEGARLHALVEDLAVAGVTRVTRPGLMGLPSMMWRHDGMPCLARLVRFSDEEVLAPKDNVSF